jgi:hypothetical protein
MERMSAGKKYSDQLNEPNFQIPESYRIAFPHQSVCHIVYLLFSNSTTVHGIELCPRDQGQTSQGPAPMPPAAADETGRTTGVEGYSNRGWPYIL